jgi:hypothetical protein
MDEQDPNLLRRDGSGEQMEKRSATEIIVGLGAPAIISAGVIGAKLIDRLQKKGDEQQDSKKE